MLRLGADGFTVPPKEGVLLICVALGRDWTREPLRSTGKQADHYTTEDETRYY
jgi:hypothetical protein